MSPRNLVTGGAGFVGSHPVDSLMQTGREVICVQAAESGGQRTPVNTRNAATAVKCIRTKPQDSAFPAGHPGSTRARSPSQPVRVEYHRPPACCVIERFPVSKSTQKASKPEPVEEQRTTEQHHKPLEQANMWNATCRTSRIQPSPIRFEKYALIVKNDLAKEVAIKVTMKYSAQQMWTHQYGPSERHHCTQSN